MGWLPALALLAPRDRPPPPARGGAAASSPLGGRSAGAWRPLLAEGGSGAVGEAPARSPEGEAPQLLKRGTGPADPPAPPPLAPRSDGSGAGGADARSSGGGSWLCATKRC
jgi:hypothetical protein